MALEDEPGPVLTPLASPYPVPQQRGDLSQGMAYDLGNWLSPTGALDGQISLIEAQTGYNRSVADGAAAYAHGLGQANDGLGITGEAGALGSVLLQADPASGFEQGIPHDQFVTNEEAPYLLLWNALRENIDFISSSLKTIYDQLFPSGGPNG
jgi:hypothetical protein